MSVNYQPVPESFSFPEMEETIAKYWDQNNIFQKSLDHRQDAPRFSFYEGPPTVNGQPGIHHILARTIKDLFCRYKTLRGFYVRRQAGWDCHGLPVELAAEKKLGITEKSDIERLGIEEFNAVCRSIVEENIANESGWRSMTQRMGYWLDMDAAYVTCDNNYIESVWWALKQFFDKGLIYKGYKVVPVSPTLGTPLSSHELSLNYRDVRDANCFIKVFLEKGQADFPAGTAVLVWTTTPWTLFGNVALAVNPDLEYVLVRLQGADGSNAAEHFVIAKDRLEVLTETYEIADTFQGKDIVGCRYTPIFPETTSTELPGVCRIYEAGFVTATEGTGVVHIAPAFGQDDFELAKRFALPVIQPVGTDGRFTSDVPGLAGRPVKTFRYGDRAEEGAERDIVKTLKERGQLYRNSFDYLHSYPHCWRTDNPVIYYARDSWFIKSPEYRDVLVAQNKNIQWHPPEFGEGRFGNWLEDVKEWSLSRNRYWGTPLPFWVSEDGTQVIAIGSIKELMEGLYEDEDGSLVPLKELSANIDLHRPYVDRVVLDRDGVRYRRTTEVADVWFDSGAMPFAQFHYPFDNQEEFNLSFPADFIAEGIDQTRGWFYTLHNIASALFEQPAYRHVVVNDLILDSNGQKMSKSKGNTLDPMEVMNTYGADATRWYLIASSPLHKPKLFNGQDIARTVVADVFRSLVNTYSFFAMYANIDGYTGTEEEIELSERSEIDRWILSRLNSVTREFCFAMDNYDPTKACRLIREFVVEDLSNWYVRRNRRRFWKGEFDSDKLSAYQSLAQVLIRTAQMISPVSPFLGDFIFLRMQSNIQHESVHCSILHSFDEQVINDELEHRMWQAQHIVFLARSLREKARIKTRQPLRRILLPVDSPSRRRSFQSIEDVILEEINVKVVEYVNDETGIVRRSARPNFKVIGKKYGSNTKHIAESIRNLTNEDIRSLEKSSVLTIAVDTVPTQIDYEDVEIVSEDIEGWLVATDSGITVALDTELDESLIAEGLAREFVSRIQKLRKESGFEVTDRIRIDFHADDDTSTSLTLMKVYIASETLAEAIQRKDVPLNHEFDINGRLVTVTVERS